VQRAAVSAAFAPILGGAAPASVPGQDALLALWRDMQSASATSAELSACALDAESGAALQALAGSHAVRGMSESARAGLERLLPRVLHAARHSAAPQLALPRLLRLLHNIARRPAYLALLEESPAALQRLATLCAERAFLAARVLAQPLLLDDVLDPRIEQLPLKAAAIAAEIAHLLEALDERGPDAELERINEARASLAFRLGLAFADARADALATARRLAALAEAVLNAVLRLAEGELVARHGRLPGPGLGFCVIGYGSFGGHELGFASDLDVAFVYDAARAALSSDGARPLEGSQWYQRLAQRVVHWLGTVTRAGQLYAVDTRLRPDGSKSLLVQSMDAYADYQQQRAWTWEHQALVRARAVCGDARLSATFAQVRQRVLAQPRAAAQVAAEVSTMRERWRAERDRSDGGRFDLKQGAGGLLDLEFLLQGLVLMHAARMPLLTESTSTAALIGALESARALAPASAAVLRAAHAALLQRALTCTLDDRPRLLAREPTLQQHADAVLRVAVACGFAFAPMQPTADSG
jgi:glutamate-ammonia-ligase adenylyltransferase